jgi:hypothetical protein
MTFLSLIGFFLLWTEAGARSPANPLQRDSVAEPLFCTYTEEREVGEKPLAVGKLHAYIGLGRVRFTFLTIGLYEMMWET